MLVGIGPVKKSRTTKGWSLGDLRGGGGGGGTVLITWSDLRNYESIEQKAKVVESPCGWYRRIWRPRGANFMRVMIEPVCVSEIGPTIYVIVDIQIVCSNTA